jgi:hypothetical protein
MFHAFGDVKRVKDQHDVGGSSSETVPHHSAQRTRKVQGKNAAGAVRACLIQMPPIFRRSQHRNHFPPTIGSSQRVMAMEPLV